jgi:(p)ppGpp synthase/HD superfamily hydrolase
MTTPQNPAVAVPAAQLLVMPLHAITEIHGEAGLRQRLTVEIQRLPAADRRTVADAAAWAAQLHAGQRRTREPYLNHLLRVTLRILCYYHVTDPDLLVAALLHDSVEDQPWAMIDQPTSHGPPPRDQAFAELTARHGLHVTQLVDAVTNPEHQVGVDRTRQYIDHLTTALADQPWARVIKLSDFTDNGVGIIHTIGPKIERSARKYTGAVPVLRELLDRPDTPLALTVKDHIHHQLDLAEHRFSAILAA